MSTNTSETISLLQSIGQSYFGLNEKELREQQDVEGLIEYYIKHNYKKAKEIFRRKNNWLMLGKIYHYGGTNITQDYTKAKIYYELAVEQGNTQALVELGVLYCYGYGVKKDDTRAKSYWEQALEQGNSWGLIKLGEFYCYGHNITHDYDKAKSYWEQAVEQGNSQGLVELGFLCYNNNSFTKAKQYYEQAVEQGNSDGAFELGQLHSNFEYDYTRANQYYKLAYKQGRKGALHYIGTQDCCTIL